MFYGMGKIVCEIDTTCCRLIDVIDAGLTIAGPWPLEMTMCMIVEKVKRAQQFSGGMVLRGGLSDAKSTQ
jgi:hypothetical protein